MLGSETCKEALCLSGSQLVLTQLLLVVAPSPCPFFSLNSIRLCCPPERASIFTAAVIPRVDVQVFAVLYCRVYLKQHRRNTARSVLGQLTPAGVQMPLHNILHGQTVQHVSGQSSSAFILPASPELESGPFEQRAVPSHKKKKKGQSTTHTQKRGGRATPVLI